MYFTQQSGFHHLFLHGSYRYGTSSAKLALNRAAVFLRMTSKYASSEKSSACQYWQAAESRLPTIPVPTVATSSTVATLPVSAACYQTCGQHVITHKYGNFIIIDCIYRRLPPTLVALVYHIIVYQTGGMKQFQRQCRMKALIHTMSPNSLAVSITRIGRIIFPFVS